MASPGYLLALSPCHLSDGQPHWISTTPATLCYCNPEVGKSQVQKKGTVWSYCKSRPAYVIQKSAIHPVWSCRALHGRALGHRLTASSFGHPPCRTPLSRRCLAVGWRLYARICAVWGGLTICRGWSVPSGGRRRSSLSRCIPSPGPRTSRRGGIVAKLRLCTALSLPQTWMASMTRESPRSEENQPPAHGLGY
jgi:hypothetical protein